MSIEIDLQGVEAWSSGVLLPPGEYLVEVDEADERVSTGGFPQVELQLRAIGGTEDGGTIRDWVTVSPESAGRVKQVLEAFGVANLDGKVSFGASEFVGKRCRIIVRSEPYEGKDRVKVKAYGPAGAAPASTATGASDSAPLAF